MWKVVSTPALHRTQCGASVRRRKNAAVYSTTKYLIMPKPNARQRILAYLQSHHGVTAAEVSRALRVTPANIRHHLSILAADGRAKVVGERRPAKGAGGAGQGRG